MMTRVVGALTRVILGGILAIAGTLVLIGPNGWGPTFRNPDLPGGMAIFFATVACTTVALSGGMIGAIFGPRLWKRWKSL